MTRRYASLKAAIAASQPTVEFVAVSLLCAFSVAKERAGPLAVAVAAMFWLMRWLIYGRLSTRTPVDWPVALLSLMALVSLGVSALPEVSLPQILRLFIGLALFYSIVNWATSASRVRLLAIGHVLVGLGLAASAPLTVQPNASRISRIIPPALYGRFSSVVGDTINPNVLAGTLVMLLAFTLGMLVFAWRSIHWTVRSLALMATLGMCAVMLLLGSRGGLAALAAALLCIVVLRLRRRSLAAMGAIVTLAGASLAVRYGAVVDSGSIGGLATRVEAWSAAILIIEDFPLSGIGIGTFGMVADRFYPLFLAAPGTIPHAHNLFLQVGVDLGIPGLVAWLATLLVVTVSAWHLYRYGRNTRDAWCEGIGAGLLASQVALVSHGFLDAVTWGMIRAAPIVWGLWGLAVAGAIWARTARAPVSPNQPEITARLQDQRLPAASC